LTEEDDEEDDEEEFTFFRAAFLTIVLRDAAFLIEEDDEEDDEEEFEEEFIFLTDLQSTCLKLRLVVIFAMSEDKTIRLNNALLIFFFATFQFRKHLYKLSTFQLSLSHIFHYERKLRKRLFEVSISISSQDHE
jgi:hypothetical protein